MTDTSALTDLASQLSPADRVVVGKVLDLIDNLATQIDQLATAIGALDKLDDLLAQRQTLQGERLDLLSARVTQLADHVIGDAGDGHSRTVPA